MEIFHIILIIFIIVLACFNIKSFIDIISLRKKIYLTNEKMEILTKIIYQLECEHADVKILDVLKEYISYDKFIFKACFECNKCKKLYYKPISELNFRERELFIKYRKDCGTIAALK